MVICAFIYILDPILFLLNTYHVAKTEIFKNKGVGFFNILNKVTDLEEVKRTKWIHFSVIFKYVIRF